MFRGRDVEEISELKPEGLSVRAISRLTGYSRGTISKYLLAPTGRPVYGPRPAAVGKLDPFKPYLNERLQAGVWNARVLLRELRERSYRGGYSILTEWLRPQRKEALSVAVRRFETPPGKQAQVGWGHFGSITEDGEVRMLWGFTITLGYSRRMMAEAATDQKLGTLLRMHEAAFQQWGAVPEEILHDRMRTIWTGTDERGEIVWNAIFLDFARYWGFTPRLWRPYRAQTKGKVESGIKCVRRNFLCGLQGREPPISPILTLSCAAGWRRWLISGSIAQRTNRCWSAGMKISSPCSRFWRGGRLIPIWMTSSGKWHATPMSHGAAAAIRCHGSMRAKTSGSGTMVTTLKFATEPKGSPYTARQSDDIR